MPVVLLLFGAIIAVAAFNNAQGTLATQLEADFPPFIKWFLAVGAIGGLGFIPGMQTISRWLLALVFAVVLLKNYTAIYAGFTNLIGAGGATATPASATPATAYQANPNAPEVTAAETTGTGSLAATGSAAAGTQAGNLNASGQPAQIAQPPFGSFDPSNYLAAFEAGFGGFGGVM